MKFYDEVKNNSYLACFFFFLNLFGDAGLVKWFYKIIKFSISNTQ